MRHLFALLLLANLIFAEGITLGNAEKGQVYYKYLIAPHLSYNGAVFTKKFKVKEWVELFSNNGEGFYKEFKLDKNSIDRETLSHIEAFAITYAKDSDNHATCSE
jgi:hypothetical protein